MKWRYLLWTALINLFAIIQVNSVLADNVQVSNTQQNVDSQAQTMLNQALNFARGHREFKDVFFKEHEQEFVRLVEEGQDPHTLFIGCSDSRMVPDLILGTRPGDLFVVRTAGNFVPPYDEKGDDGVSATIQYALEVLNVKHIIVCGHSHCGAIKGLFQTIDPTTLGILKRWLQFGEEAKQMALKVAKPGTPEKDLYSIAEQISVIYQLEHILTFPGVKKRVDNGSLVLHGWYYKIETGEVTYYDPEAYQFKPLSNLKRQKQAASLSQARK